MESIKNINVGVEFSETPIGRYAEDSDFSGQTFREEWLVPSLNNYLKVYVKIDEVEGYGSSFLDEAFGGLVRNNNFTIDDLKKKLFFICEKEDFKIYEKMIWHYIDQSKPNK